MLNLTTDPTPDLVTDLVTDPAIPGGGVTTLNLVEGDR